MSFVTGSPINMFTSNVRTMCPIGMLGAVLSGALAAQHPWRGYARLSDFDESVPRMLTVDAAVAWLQSSLSDLMLDLYLYQAGMLRKVLQDSRHVSAERLGSALAVGRSLLTDDPSGLSEAQLLERSDVLLEKRVVPRYVDSWNPHEKTVDWNLARAMGRSPRDREEGCRVRGLLYLRHVRLQSSQDAATFRAFVTSDPERQGAWENLERVWDCWHRILGDPAEPLFRLKDGPSSDRLRRCSIVPWWTPADRLCVEVSLQTGLEPEALIACLRGGGSRSLRGRLLELAAHVGTRAVEVSVDGSQEAWQRVRQGSAMAIYVAQRLIEAEAAAGPLTPRPEPIIWIVEPDPAAWRIYRDLAAAYKAIAEDVEGLLGRDMFADEWATMADMALDLLQGVTPEERRQACYGRLTQQTNAVDKITGRDPQGGALGGGARFRINAVRSEVVQLVWGGRQVKALALVRDLEVRHPGGPDASWVAWPLR